MSILVFVISLIFDTIISYSYFYGGLSNALTDLIASIPNLFWAILYLLSFPIINLFKLKPKWLFYIKNIPFILLYLYTYLFFTVNTLTITKKPVIYQRNNAIQANKLIICSQNTKHAQALNNPEFWQTLRLYKCNLIILQEVHGSFNYKSIIKQNLTQYLHKNFNIIDQGEFIIASVFPIKLAYSSNSMSFLSAQINFNNMQLLIIDTHIWTPLEAQPPEYNTYGNIKRPPFIVRKQQTAELLDYINFNLATPIILIGDFNMLPTHPFLNQQLRKSGLKRIKAKTLITPTYSTSLPIIEIDHIFTNTPYLIKNRTTLLNQFSDHAMQIIEIY